MTAPSRPRAMRSIKEPALVLGVLLVVLGACGTLGPSGSPAPDSSTDQAASPSPAPTSSGELSATALKYRLIEQVGWPWFCDPDEFPVARGNPEDTAIARFPEVQADAEVFAAIVARDAYRPEAGGLSLKTKMAIYRDWKILRAIVLEPAGDAAGFDYLQVVTGPPNETGTRTAGTIDSSGGITIVGQAPAGGPICPICLARGTLIDTPDGPRAVDELRIGDHVWTADIHGRRVAASIVAIGSVAAPAEHRVVHLVLADGRSVSASPGHPLADGRTIGGLVAGDPLDGSTVVSAELVAYGGGSTFDILPGGPTGTYWAGGILLGSTLRPQPTAAR